MKRAHKTRRGRVHYTMARVVPIPVEAVVPMRRFWWLFGLLFISTLILYTVGTGWLSAIAVKSSISHACRQLETGKIVADMQEAQQALQRHRERVMALDFIFPEPDLSSTLATYRQMEQFRRQFQSLGGSGVEDAALTPAFRASIEALETYRVPSLSVMGPGLQTGLWVATVVLGIIAALLMGVRFLGTQ
jgi:hypothetical protein